MILQSCESGYLSVHNKRVLVHVHVCVEENDELHNYMLKIWLSKYGARVKQIVTQYTVFKNGIRYRTNEQNKYGPLCGLLCGPLSSSI